MNRPRFPFDIVILSLFLIAAAVALLWWFRPPQNDQHNDPLAQYYKELEQRYAEDTYGGATPEETLQLFIAALEAGNIDLASKYFLVEKQEEEKGYLSENIKKVIEESRRLELGRIEENRALFILVNEQNIVEAQVALVRIPNGKWKISSL